MERERKMSGINSVGVGQPNNVNVGKSAPKTENEAKTPSSTEGYEPKKELMSKEEAKALTTLGLMQLGNPNIYTIANAPKYQEAYNTMKENNK